ncbi:MAG: carbohydrate ABC transporter permease [Spirochaetales bacterium]|nr:carbohydrate ABC transporter permease [Spirochaetales bacterium]
MDWKYVKKHLKKKTVPRILLMVMCLFYLLPLYWMVATSFKGSEELSSFPPTLWPHKFIWQNYRDAVEYIPFLKYFINSLIIALGVTAGSVLSNSFIAYGFSRIQWKGREVLFLIAIATMFIPFPVTLVALFDIFAKIGWINTYLPLIVPSFLGQALYLFMIRQFLMSLPKDLSSAAIIDGASEFTVFLKIMLPLMKPVLAVVAIFSGVNAWNDFLTPLIYLQTEDLYPLSIGLQFFRAEHNVAFSQLMAASTLAIVPVVILFLLFQRFFVEGITVGAVKG